MTERETATAGANAQTNFLKQIIAVMMGLSLTNTLQGFIAGQWSESFEPPPQFEEVCVLVLLLLVIVRFCYGNWIHLDQTSDPSAVVRPGFAGGKDLLNFLIVIGQSVALVVLSFYKQLYPYFFTVFAIVLLVDVIGFGLLAAIKQQRALRVQIRWLINNLFAVGALYIVGSLFQDNQFLVFWSSFAVSSVNTVIGFLISWHFYLPSVATDGD